MIRRCTITERWLINLKVCPELSWRSDTTLHGLPNTTLKIPRTPRTIEAQRQARLQLVVVYGNCAVGHPADNLQRCT